MSNTTTAAQKSTTVTTSTTPLLVNPETREILDPVNTDAVDLGEQEINQLKKSVETLATWLKVSVEDLEKLAYFIFMNKEVLMTKLKEKGLSKTWKYVTKKVGVEIDMVNLKEVIAFGFAIFKEQVINNLKEVNEQLGNLAEAELDAVIKTFQKSYKANKDIGQALNKSISKISVMGFEGKDVVKNPVVVKAIGELNAMLTPKPELKTWQPGSLSRAVAKIAQKHRSSK